MTAKAVCQLLSILSTVVNGIVVVAQKAASVAQAKAVGSYNGSRVLHLSMTFRDIQ